MRRECEDIIKQIKTFVELLLGREFNIQKGKEVPVWVDRRVG